MASETSGKSELVSPTEENSEETGYEEVDLNSPSPEGPPSTAGSSIGDTLVRAVARPLAYLSSTATQPKKQEEKAIGESAMVGDRGETETRPEIDSSSVITKETGGDLVESAVTDGPPGAVATTEDGEPVYNVRPEESDHGKDDEAAKRLIPAMSTDTERIAAVVAKESPDETFERLRKGILDEGISPKEVVNSVFQVVSVLHFFATLFLGVWDLLARKEFCGMM